MERSSENVVVLDRGYDTTCTVNLHGATIVSWIIRTEEQLFLSKFSVFNERKPIRGGIKLAFPEFGSWVFGQRHGFAQAEKWKVEKAPKKLENADVEAEFSLTETEFTRSMWNFQFRLVLHVLLRERELHVKLHVQNTDKNLPFRFISALNCHFRVQDVTRCELLGLKSCRYIDKIKDEDFFTENEDGVRIGEWTDRLYLNTPDEHIFDKSCDRLMRIRSENFCDTAVWNPWSEMVKGISDMSEDEYLKMFCLSSGVIRKPLKLYPGEEFEAKLMIHYNINDDPPPIFCW